MPRTLTVRSEGLVLDAILSAATDAVTGRSLVEATLELNPGLAALGLIIPLGTTIIIPDPPTEAVAAREVVSLFG